MAHDRFSDIGACVFDAYGTLFDVHSAAARYRADLGDAADAVSQTWRDKQLQYTWLRSLMGPQHHIDFWQLTGDALDFALETHGIDDAALREKLIACYLELDAYGEVKGVLTRLKEAGLKTAILSNGSPDMLAAGVYNAGLDGVIAVERVMVAFINDSVHLCLPERGEQQRHHRKYVSDPQTFLGHHVREYTKQLPDPVSAAAEHSPCVPSSRSV